MESASWLADPSASVQDAVEQNELSRDIYKILDELPDVYHSVITLIDINELDYAEAAQALGVPIGTVKSRLARACNCRKNLKLVWAIKKSLPWPMQISVFRILKSFRYK